MRRRDFLKAALAGTTMAATWQTGFAAGIDSHQAPQDEELNLKIPGTSLKGICASDLKPETINGLSPDWIYSIFGPWCADSNIRFNNKWTFHLYDMVPDPAVVAAAVQHPNYDKWWLTLNEPDTEGISPADAAVLITKQMDTVLSVDPSARFCVSTGSQLHAIKTPEPWFPPMWSRLPNSLKPHVHAFHTHYYAQAQFGHVADKVFTPEPIIKYLKKWRKWMNRNAGEFRRELWLTEIGLAVEGIGNDRRVPLYPLLVQLAVNGFAERWAWYSLDKRDGYVTLMDPAGVSGQTAAGTVFAAMQPGTYPIRQA